jgi:hypothetical protein
VWVLQLSDAVDAELTVMHVIDVNTIDALIVWACWPFPRTRQHSESGYGITLA